MHEDLGCDDCNTSNDIHGFGNIYSKREQAVEIECTDCHGRIDAYSNMKRSRNNPMTNLEKQNEQILLKGKIDGNFHNIPFELERIVDKDGNQIQATRHVGARPFNKEQMEKISRLYVSLGSHQETASIFWEKVKEKWGDKE